MENISHEEKYNQISSLSDSLKTVLQTKTPLDNEVMDIQLRVKELGESLIFSSFEYSCSKDVESTIWKVFYRIIDEFRRTAKKRESDKRLNQQVLTRFRAFLIQISGFYLHLIEKTQRKYGLRLDRSESLNLMEQQEGKSKIKLMAIQTCHRSLIYLGDLARYRESLTGTKDFSCSREYYYESLKIYPSSGNPHNQLAVLATYEEKEILAVYHYFFSLCVPFPFTTAEENLKSIFQKNRVKCSNYHSNSSDKSSNILFDTCFSDFTVHFIRVHGILHSSSEINMLDFVESKALENLGFIFKKKSDLVDKTTLQNIFVISMSSIHKLKSHVNYSHGIEFIFQLFTRTLIHTKKLCLQLKKKKGGQPFGKVMNSLERVLPSIKLMCSWMECNAKSWADIISVQDETGIQFWTEFSDCLNVLWTTFPIDVVSNWKQTLPLPEDLETISFIPLKESHSQLDWSKVRSHSTYASKELVDERVKSIFATANFFTKNPQYLIIKIIGEKPVKSVSFQPHFMTLEEVGRRRRNSGNQIEIDGQEEDLEDDNEEDEDASMAGEGSDEIQDYEVERVPIHEDEVNSDDDDSEGDIVTFKGEDHLMPEQEFDQKPKTGLDYIHPPVHSPAIPLTPTSSSHDYSLWGTKSPFGLEKIEAPTSNTNISNGQLFTNPIPGSSNLYQQTSFLDMLNPQNVPHSGFSFMSPVSDSFSPDYKRENKSSLTNFIDFPFAQPPQSQPNLTQRQVRPPPGFQNHNYGYPLTLTGNSTLMPYFNQTTNHNFNQSNSNAFLDSLNETDVLQSIIGKKSDSS